jgi:diguanylate cyclase (GGDEF)-like protein/PAS domain S-box-containing protein
MRSVFFLLCWLVLAPAWALEQVVLQLNWKHQFQFAGYYAAIEQGYFRDAGFEVTLRELQEGADPIQVVLDGDADFGVAASELALHRAQGKPVVALATIVQHSPLILLVNRRQVSTVDSLQGSRIMLTPHETELFAYLRREDITQFTTVPHSFDTKDLMEGRVDAMSGYTTDEPYLLRQAGFPYLIFNPTAVGIHFYGDTLFTTADRIKPSPERARAFRAAAIKGWRYALANPETVADLILAKYSQRHERAHLLFEANELKRLMQPDLVEIGQQSASRWQQIIETYAELGMVPSTAKIDGLIFDADEHKLPTWIWYALAGGGLLILMVGAAAFYFARLNMRLNREVASRREFEIALRASEERYRQLADFSEDVIWTLDLHSKRFTYVSPSIEKVRGFTVAEASAQSMLDALTPESLARVQAIMAEHLRRIAQGDLTALSATAEIEQPHKRGGTIHAEVAGTFLLDAQGQPYALLGISRDISERRRAEHELRQANETLRRQLEEIEKLQGALKEQTIRDSLTGCFNRRYLDETLERELSRSRREGYPLSLVIIDLDFFKQINDTYGHLAGDRALIVLAETLRADIRHEDVLCRYGGEEFVILMPRMPLDKAVERAESWRCKIADIRVAFGNFKLSFTASAGVAAYPDHGKMPDELTHAADTALYVAKNSGRNRVVAYCPARAELVAAAAAAGIP